jgi:hypothetical protein
MLQNNKKINRPTTSVTEKVRSALPEISSKDVKDFSALISSERAFYQRMGLSFISEMLA